MMNTKYPLSGVVASLNTPFDEYGEIDFESMARLIEMHLREGAVGFLAPAQAGEVSALSIAERVEIIRFVQQQLGGRAAFFAGATSPNSKESCIIAEAALKSGCRAVLVEVPPAFRSERAAAVEFCRSIAQVGMPILAIQDLDWEGFGIDVSWIVELWETLECFKCLKVEVRPAGPKYTQVIEATRGQLNVAGGWAAEQMVEALDRGVDIYMPTAMTRWYAKIVRNHSAGEREAAFETFRAILPVLAFTRQHIDISIQFYKRLMVRRGIFRTANTRKKCLTYDGFHARYGEELINYLDRLYDLPD
jgi:dihydrodipicolinate synthase/N-acetylneuraminate lyase